MRRTTFFASLAFAGAATVAGAQAPVKIGGVRGDFLGNFSQVESKFIQLAEAFPVDKYNYTPGKGVRSFCEVLVHISAENYEMGKAFGAVAPPKELANAESSTCYADKPTVIAAMKASFSAIKTGVTNTKDSDLDGSFTLFGFPQARRTWLLGTAEHAGEHLGQLIAYARVNNIKPPWSK